MAVGKNKRLSKGKKGKGKKVYAGSARLECSARGWRPECGARRSARSMPDDALHALALASTPPQRRPLHEEGVV